MVKEAYNGFWIWQILISKKVIGGLVLCTALVYVVSSPFITKPLYESETIVYAPLTILSQQLNQQGIGFANTYEIDSYIQILNSHLVMDSLILHFSLKDNSNQINSDLYRKMESRIKIEKTRYSSVSIKVRDHDPNKAAAMANYMVMVVEILKQKLFYPNRLEALDYSRSLLEQKALQVSNLEHNLDSLESTNSNKTSRSYNRILNLYQQELQELNLRKNQYEHAQWEFNTPLPKAFVVSDAVVCNKPVWPHPWINCMIAIFSYVGIILILEIVKRDYKQLEV